MNSTDDYRMALLELLSSKFDSDSTKSEEYAEQLLGIHAEFLKRNGKLSTLLGDYISQREDRVKTNRFLKKIIFWVFVFLLVVLTLTVAVFVICNRNRESVASMVSLISVLLTYLASLIAVFEIISKYLFPIDEEKDTINMIQTVISNDLQVEKFTSTAIEKSNGKIIENLKILKQLCDAGILTKDEFDEIKGDFIKKIKGC